MTNDTTTRRKRTRSRDFGSIRKRDNGKWQARYNDLAGQRHSRMFDTKSDAAAWLATVKADLLRHDWINPHRARVTFGEWADEWLSTSIHLRPKTADAYDRLLRNRILPVFGGQAVASIETPDVQRFVTRLRNQGVPTGTVSKCRAVMRSVFKCAAGNNAIKGNPCDGVRVGESHAREVTPLTVTDVEELANAMTCDEYTLLVRFAAYTGLRASEVAGLRVRSFDPVRREVRVVETLGELNGQLIEGPPKSRASRRSVPVPSSLVPDLMALVSGRPRDARVFTARDGGPLRWQNFYNREFRPAAKRAGLAGTRFHDLRHTYVALLIEQGAHPKEIQQRVGHHSITVTMDTYGHLFPHLSDAVTDRLDAVVRAVSETATVTPLRAAAS